MPSNVGNYGLRQIFLHAIPTIKLFSIEKTLKIREELQVKEFIEFFYRVDSQEVCR